jgi:predicted ATPase/class 3 adenylate cyclase
MELRLLGPPALYDDGEAVPLGRRETVVLTLLALARPGAVTLDRLVDELWPDRSPGNPAKVVQNVVLRLRKALGDDTAVAVHTTSGGYELRAVPEAVDVDRVEWRGTPLAGLEDHPFAVREQSRLHERRTQLVESRADALLAAGRPGDAVLALEPECADEPVRERLWRLLMVALYRCGRQADAIAAARALRDNLVELGGLDPDPGTSALEGALRRQDPSLDHGEPRLPAGMVTFLFADVVASTELFVRLGARWVETAQVLLRQIGGAVTGHGGVVVDTNGDGVLAAFDDAAAAVAAAVAIVAAPACVSDHLETRPALRVGVHTGEAEPIDGGYIALPVHVAARVIAAAHGGQILVSGATADLLVTEATTDHDLHELGYFELRGIPDSVQLFELVPAGAAPSTMPLRALQALRHNLPLNPNLFVGRDDELVDVGALLDEARNVTLVGPGGVGKTRLAVEVAARSLDRYPDGVCLVELAPVADGVLVPSAAAAALGVAESLVDSVAEAVVRALSPRRLLLVLDNCEHVIDAAAALVRMVLARCPGVRVLATSREPLSVEAEAVWRLAPLLLPPPDATLSADEALRYDSVQLFTARLRAADAQAVLTDQAAPVVASVVRSLDGLPLAIELAASAAVTVGLEEVRRGLRDRLDLLEGSGAHPDRHRRLRATLEWSHSLLTTDEQVVYRRLGVFADACDAAAAVAVCADGRLSAIDVRRALSRLVERSVLSRGPDLLHARFRLLETMRVHAEQLLAEAGETRATRDRLAQWLLERAKPLSTSSVPDPAALAELTDHLDDIRASCEHLVEHDAADAVLLLVRLRPLWQRLLIWPEVLSRLTWAWEAAGVLEPPLLAGAHELMARGLKGIDLLGAIRHARLAIEVLPPSSYVDRSRAHVVLANLLVNSGDTRGADAAIAEALRLGALAQDGAAEIDAADEVTTLSLYVGDYRRTIELADSYAPGARHRGDLHLETSLLGLKAVALKHLGDVEAAVELARRGVAMWMAGRTSYPSEGWWSAAVLAEMYVAVEDERAAGLLRWLLETVGRHDAFAHIDLFRDVGLVARSLGDHEVAVGMLAAAETAGRRISFGLPRGLAAEVEADILACRETVGRQAFHDAWRSGAAWSAEEALTAAFAVLDRLVPAQRAAWWSTPEVAAAQ